MYLAEERKISQLAEKMKPDVIIIFDNNNLANYSFIEELELIDAEIIYEFSTPYSESNVYFLKLNRDRAIVKIYDYNAQELVEELTVKRGDVIVLSKQVLARKADEYDC